MGTAALFAPFSLHLFSPPPPPPFFFPCAALFPSASLPLSPSPSLFLFFFVVCASLHSRETPSLLLLYNSSFSFCLHRTFLPTCLFLFFVLLPHPIVIMPQPQPVLKSHHHTKTDPKTKLAMHVKFHHSVMVLVENYYHTVKKNRLHVNIFDLVASISSIRFNLSSSYAVSGASEGPAELLSLPSSSP